MITSAKLTLSELKQMIAELLLNKTNKVSDVGDDSVVNGLIFGSARIGQKAIKDIAIVESQIFPQTAKGEYLDRSAELFGVSERRGALGSSTYVRVVAAQGTLYEAGVNNFISANGVQFELEENFTVGVEQIGYAKVRSIDTGSKTNVEANSIITVTPEPTGHVDVVNEYISTGGADEESDEVFRTRVVNNSNILSRTTLEYYTLIFQNLDDRVLKVINNGKNEDGKQEMLIVTQNGVSLTQQELDDLLEQAKGFFPLTDLNQYGDVLGVTLGNVQWYHIGGDTGIDFRVEIENLYNSDTVRREIQINLSKALDFRFWEAGQKVEWDDLLDVVKKTEGVKYVPDLYFSPRNDESVPFNQLPRIYKFVMRDLSGSIIYDNDGNLTPIFYPSE